MLLFSLASPQAVAGTLACLFVTWCVAERMVIASKHSGRIGQRASIDGGNPITAILHLWRFAKAQKERKFFEFFEDLNARADPSSPYCTEILIGARRILLTSDAKQIKAILATQFDQFQKGPRFRTIWGPLLGESIFATDGEKWHQNRKLLRPMFSKERLSDLNIFQKHTDTLMSKLPPSGQTVDMCDMFYRLTMDVITDFLLGRAVGSLSRPENEFAQTFADVQSRQIIRAITWPIRWMRATDTAYFEGIKKMDHFVEPYIQEALGVPEKELNALSESGEELTFLQHIALFTRDTRLVRDQIIAVLLAGRDTTGATFSWTLYELSNYPEAWKKLRNEVLSTVGVDGKPTYETLKSMKYLRNVLNESMRLHPSIPMNVRSCRESTTLPGAEGQPDILVDKGDSVIYSVLNMQLRKDLYPPTSDNFADPAIFSPERWETWTPEPWHLVPFNGGPRICIGQNFALTEMTFTFVRLAQKYERLEYRADWNAQFLKTDIVGHPGQGVPVAFFEPGQ